MTTYHFNVEDNENLVTYHFNVEYDEHETPNEGRHERTE